MGVNFGQTIWDKTQVLLGTLWEHDGNTLRTRENKKQKKSLFPHPLKKKKLDLSPIDNKFPLISIGINSCEISWEKPFKKTQGILENGTPMLVVGIPIFKKSCKSFTICKCNSKYTKKNVRGFKWPKTNFGGNFLNFFLI
jgi:hypothetical protein